MAKKTYYEDQLIKYKQNSRMVWKTLNELLKKPKKNTKISQTFVEISLLTEVSICAGKRRRRDLCLDLTRFLSRMCKNCHDNESCSPRDIKPVFAGATW
jgi:hypothetical protein